MRALSVLDQFKPFPSYNILSELKILIILLDKHSFGKSLYTPPPLLLAPHLAILTFDAL